MEVPVVGRYFRHFSAAAGAAAPNAAMSETANAGVATIVGNTAL
jgi:hypothetical protein